MTDINSLTLRSRCYKRTSFYLIALFAPERSSRALTSSAPVFVDELCKNSLFSFSFSNLFCKALNSTLYCSISFSRYLKSLSLPSSISWTPFSSPRTYFLSFSRNSIYFRSPFACLSLSLIIFSFVSRVLFKSTI